MNTKYDIQELIYQNRIELNSTHTKLCIPIIKRMYKKMKAGVRFPTYSTSATMITPWESVIFEDEDWDTKAKIKMLNQQDADYNEISIEKIIDMLK